MRRREFIKSATATGMLAVSSFSPFARKKVKHISDKVLLGNTGKQGAYFYKRYTALTPTQFSKPGNKKRNLFEKVRIMSFFSKNM